MRKVVLRGGGAGAVVGIVVSQLIGLAVIGTDDIKDFAGREDLPGLYAVAALIGIVVGLVMGVAGLAVGRGVADASTASPTRRRAYGAAAGGATAGALSLFTTSPVLFTRAPLTFVALGLVGAAATWFLLPGVVDLESDRTPEDELPAWGGPAEQAPPMSGGRRIATTLLGGGLGALVATQVVMSLVPLGASLGRAASDVVAFVVLAVLFVVITTFLWRLTGRPREFRGQEPLR